MNNNNTITDDDYELCIACGLHIDTKQLEKSNDNAIVKYCKSSKDKVNRILTQTIPKALRVNIGDDVFLRLIP